MSKDEINAFLGAGTVYEGRLSFQGSVRMDGIFTGTIQSEGTLIVGKDAKVTGEIKVGQLILAGNLQGEIEASKRAAVNSTGILIGNLFSPVLVVEEGGVLEGRVIMREQSKTQSEFATQEETYQETYENP